MPSHSPAELSRSIADDEVCAGLQSDGCETTFFQLMPMTSFSFSFPLLSLLLTGASIASSSSSASSSASAVGSADSSGQTCSTLMAPVASLGRTCPSSTMACSSRTSWAAVHQAGSVGSRRCFGTLWPGYGQRFRRGSGEGQKRMLKTERLRAFAEQGLRS